MPAVGRRLPGEHQHMIWIEGEEQIKQVTKFDPLLGKTGKGGLFYISHEGGHRAVDVEDIIEINDHPVLTRAPRSRKQIAKRKRKK